MKIIYYILDKDHNIIPTEDIEIWGKFFSNIENRRVAYDEIDDGIGIISTVFLGIDHGFCSDELILFETAVLDTEGRGCDIFRRYKTWDEAFAGHNKVVEELKQNHVIF